MWFSVTEYKVAIPVNQLVCHGLWPSLCPVTRSSLLPEMKNYGNWVLPVIGHPVIGSTQYRVRVHFGFFLPRKSSLKMNVITTVYSKSNP
jgi:hypothetical protein